MNEAQLRAMVTLLDSLAQAFLDAGNALVDLVTKLRTRLDRSNPINLPLGQTEITGIVAAYTPLYTVIKTAIQNAVARLP